MNRKGFAAIIVVLAILALIIVGGIIYFYAVGSGPASQSTVGQNQPSQKAHIQPSIHDINVHTGSANSGFNFQFSNGHYLLQTNSQQLNTKTGEKPADDVKLIYDGKTVYENANAPAGYALSKNGQHYGFGLSVSDKNAPSGDQECITEYYLDGQKISLNYPPENYNDPSRGANEYCGSLISITDDGQHYFYADPYNKIITKDGNQIIYNGVPFTSVVFSADGSKYAIEKPTNVNTGQPPLAHGNQILMNGEVDICHVGIHDSLSYSLSNDGQHYICSTISHKALYPGYSPSNPAWDYSLYVDSTQSTLVNQSTGTDSEGFKIVDITDQGHYLAYDKTALKMYLDGKVLAEGAGGLAYINNDASHVLGYDGTNWTLDGVTTSLDFNKKTDTAEIVGNDVYLYHLIP